LCGVGESPPVWTGAETSAVQGTAYVVSAASEALLHRFARRASELLDGEAVRGRIERTRNILEERTLKPLADGWGSRSTCAWPEALRRSDGRGRGGRIEAGAYSVFLCEDDKFEAMLKEWTAVTEHDFGIFLDNYHGRRAVLLREPRFLAP
jgi:hypothetical protein